MEGFVITGLLFISGIVFVPAAIIGWYMLGSLRNALAVSLFFTAGALLGYCGGGYLAHAVLGLRFQGDADRVALLAVASGFAICGGVIAVWLLVKLSGKSPWSKT